MIFARRARIARAIGAMTRGTLVGVDGGVLLERQRSVTRGAARLLPTGMGCVESDGDLAGGARRRWDNVSRGGRCSCVLWRCGGATGEDDRCAQQRDRAIAMFSSRNRRSTRGKVMAAGRLQHAVLVEEVSLIVGRSAMSRRPPVALGRVSDAFLSLAGRIGLDREKIPSEQENCTIQGGIILASAASVNSLMIQ